MNEPWTQRSLVVYKSQANHKLPPSWYHLLLPPPLFHSSTTFLRKQLRTPNFIKMGFYKRKITVSDDVVTSAVHLTLKQSIIPCLLGKPCASDLSITHILTISQSPFSSSSGKLHRTAQLLWTQLTSIGALPTVFSMSSILISKLPSTSRPPEPLVSQLPTSAHTSCVLQLSPAGSYASGVFALHL